VGLLLGLGIGVHHVTVILAVPGLLAFLVVAGGWRAVAPRRLLGAVAGGVAGLLSYLYLPLAAARRPVLNWGDPSNLERFWWHVSARQYRVNLFAGSLDQVKENLAAFAQLARLELGPVGVVAVAAGLLWLWRRDRATLALVVLVALLGVTYAVNYEIAEDTEAYFLTTFLMAAVALGGGLAWLLSASRGRSGLTALALVAAAATPAATAVLHWRVCDRSRDMVARRFVEDAVAGVAPSGVLLTLDWQLYAPWLYLHHIEDLRPDAALVDVNLCRRSWYVGQYLPAAYPDLLAEVQRPVDVFRVELEKWEHDRPHDPARLDRLFVAMLNAMLSAPRAGGQAYVTLPMEPGVGGERAWVPHGLTMKLETAPSTRVEPAPPLHLEPLLGDPASLTAVARTKVRPYYALMLSNRARYLAMMGDRDGARAVLDQALSLEPSMAALHLLGGDLDLASGRVDAARQAYETALRLDPDNREVAARLRQLDAGDRRSQAPAPDAG
jgi:tetratricopeptide (TPR) repeat protein